MPASAWQKTKSVSKRGFDTAWNTLDKLGAPVNKLSNKIGSEAFWPTTLDKESDKAARILRSFCKDGFYANLDTQQAEQAEKTGEQVEGPKGKQRVLKKIPTDVIKNAKGLAIFTTMRTGLWVSGAGGSGILVGRIPETGEWSPPTGIMLHTAGLGFLVGVDIYDCVIVINTYDALAAFTKIRCTLGGEVSAVAGPVGIGGVLETEVHKRQAPVWTYLKSRGFYAGIQVDGTVVIERTDENERFYGEKLPARDILAGKAKRPPSSIKMLMETIKVAQGDQNVDESVLPQPGLTPSDMEVETGDGKAFGIPAEDDPDPYGVKALENEGLEIREAGTQKRPSVEAFKFQPSPTSPIFSSFNRRSIDSQRSSQRISRMSMSSVDRGTQTDDLELPRSPIVLRSLNHSPVDETTEGSKPPVTTDESIPKLGEPFVEQSNTSTSNHSEPHRLSEIPQILTTPPESPDRMATSELANNPESTEEITALNDNHKQDEPEHVDANPESPVQTAATTHIVSASPASPSRARLVTIQSKRAVPPALPPRSPFDLPPQLPPRNPIRNQAEESDTITPAYTPSEYSIDSEGRAINDAKNVEDGQLDGISMHDHDHDYDDVVENGDSLDGNLENSTPTKTNTIANAEGNDDASNPKPSTSAKEEHSIDDDASATADGSSTANSVLPSPVVPGAF